jgi:hypothetical protein
MLSRRRVLAALSAVAIAAGFSGATLTATPAAADRGAPIVTVTVTPAD